MTFAMAFTAALLLAPGAAGAAPPTAPTHVGAPGDIPAIVARVVPAVVSVAIREIQRDQFGRTTAIPGLGSGIIVDRRGYIVTNFHVVEGASQLKVTLADGRAFKGALVGSDRFTDLAVIKIEGTGLPAATLGDSSRLVVGQTVVAIGNPLWIEGGPTVTVGVVSGLGRSMEQDGLPTLHGLVQTDAAINPGNSGGPLVDRAGRVVGINTALIPSAHGIGFAIAMNTARPVMKALIGEGRIARVSIGAVAVSLTPQVAFANDLPIEHGALVTRLEPGGPAEVAGIEVGDVLTGVNGRRITDLHGLHEELFRHRAGDTIEVAIWRDGRTLTVRASLEEYQ
jgi:serine protease Do